MAIETLVEEPIARTEVRVPYRTFAEIFLEQPHYKGEEKLGYTTQNEILVPTWCTWKAVPVIDDADELF